MKTTQLIIFLFSLLLLSATDAKNNKRSVCERVDEPERYSTAWEEFQEYPTDIIGKGCGESREEAKDQASRDIASQIKIRIKRSNRCETRTSRNSVTDAYQERCESEILSEVEATLEGVKPLFSQKVKERKGRSKRAAYFVVLRYDNAPLVEKVSRTIATKNNRFCRTLKLTFRFDELLRNTLSNNSSFEKCKAFRWRLNWNRDFGLWQVEVGTASWNITTTNLREWFWPKNQRSEYLTLELVNEPPTGEGYFFIRLKGNARSADKRHLSLFSVNGSGGTTIADMELSSEAVQSFETEFPDREQYSGLKAVQEGDSDGAHEFYMATLCKQEISPQKFLKIGEVAQSGNNDYYRYGELLDVVNDPSYGCHIAIKETLIQN